MPEDGQYSVWYHTPRGESSGTLRLKNGKISGEGTTLVYDGSYEIDGDRFVATIKTSRRDIKQPSLLGIDEMEIIVTGKAPDGKIVASCSGYAKQAPGLLFDVTLVRMAD